MIGSPRIILAAVLIAPTLLLAYFPRIEVIPALRLSFDTGPCGVYQKLVQTAFVEPEGRELLPYLSRVYADRPRVVHLLVEEPTSVRFALGAYFPGREWVLERMGLVPPELWDAFDGMPHDSKAHSCRFDIPFTVVPMSEAEVEEMFDDSLYGWVRFHERHPDSRGIMTLSRIAFDSRRTEALVLIGIQSRGTEGAGYFAYLRREKGTWAVKQAAQVWVS